MLMKVASYWLYGTLSRLAIINLLHLPVQISGNRSDHRMYVWETDWPTAVEQQESYWWGLFATLNQRRRMVHVA